MSVDTKDDRSQRARIVKAAARLFAERGYHAVGMTELQNAVQLGRGALYHHIRSKDDLLYDIAREYITDLVRATRTDPALRLGASPRGSLDLMRAAQALAALRGREYVLPDDVKHLAVSVLAHRLLVKEEERLRGKSARGRRR